MQAQERQTGSSLSFFSRGWTAQAAAEGTWMPVSLPQKGQYDPEALKGQPHTSERSLQLAGFPSTH